MALRALVKADLNKRVPDKNSVSILYRSIIRELPRVLIIYDVDMPLKTAKAAVQFHFRKYGHLKDGNVIGMLMAKGYMELEETLMQWKQKTHLLRVLEPKELQPDFNRILTAREKLILNIQDDSDDEEEHYRLPANNRIPPAAKPSRESYFVRKQSDEEI